MSVLINLSLLNKNQSAKKRFEGIEMLFSLMDQKQVKPNQVTQLRVSSTTKILTFDVI